MSIFLSTTMSSAAIIAVSPWLREEMDIIAVFIPLGSEIEYATFALVFSFPLSVRNLAFESLLTITITPCANDRTPPQICHVFNITLQPVQNIFAALFTFPLFCLGTGGDGCCRELTKRRWNNWKDQAIPIESAERRARHQRSNNSPLRYFLAFGFGSLEGCGAEFAIFEFISHQVKAQTNMIFACPFLSSPLRVCTSAPVKAPEGM